MKGKQSPSRAHGEAEKGKIGKRDKVKSVYDILLTGFFWVKVLDRYHMMGERKRNGNELQFEFGSFRRSLPCNGINAKTM
jgi:hypothetical protein